MKTILCTLCILLSLSLFSQNYPITSITISLPPNPDASTANWKSGTSMLTISAMARAVNGRPDVRVEDSKVLVMIKRSGSKACGSFTSASAPAANFTTLSKVWSGNNAITLLGQECTLPAGEYELCVQLFGNGPRGLEPISEEKCRTFTIRGNEQQSYQPPQPLSPANGIAFKEADIKKPITFRWTPVIPKPKETVTYRLKVWQLMEGQNGIQAMKSNQPVITKDVDNLTQAIISNLIDVPCKASSLCEFVWNVQALNRDGKPIGINNGTSETFTITVQPVNDPPTIIKLVDPANRSIVYSNPKFSWTLTLGDYDGDGYFKIKIVEIKGDQSPEHAFKGNKPFFEKDSIQELSLTVPIKTGMYAWQIQAFNRDGKPIGSNNGTSETFTFTIPPIAANDTRLSLVSPGNGETVSLPNPTFNWTFGPTPADYDGDGYFKIKIVEIKGDESPDNAIRTNKPHFEKDSIKYFKGNKPFFEKDSLKELSFKYPSSAPKLEAGKRYAWNIQLCEECTDEPSAVSEIFTFQVASKKTEPRLRLVSPANGAVLDTDPQFTWTDFPNPRDVDGDGYYKIKIVEIKGDQSPEQAFKGNKPFFEKDSIKSLYFQYSSSVPKLDEGKRYAWGIASGKLLSAVWLFRTKPVKQSCKDFKVTITKNERASNKEACCYNISITNNSKGPLQIQGFRIITKGFYVLSASDPLKEWERKPQKLPNESNDITWTKPRTSIPTGKTEVGTVCLTRIEKDPFYLVYEWLDAKGNILCKDSIQVAACKVEGCKNDMIRNGGFVQRNSPGLMPSPGSVQNWTNAYGTPLVNNNPNDGFIEEGCVRLSGNVATGQALAQSLDPNNKILQGKKYKISIAVRFKAEENTLDYVKIRTIAFNGSVTSSAGTHPTPSTDVAIISRSAKIKDCGDWSVIELPVWTAAKDFSNIAVNAFTNDNTTASVWIDNISVCETDESGCDEVQTDQNGEPIMPSGYGTLPAGTACVTEAEEDEYFNGSLQDLYPGYNGTTSIYANNAGNCFNIGGTLPSEVEEEFDCDQALKEAGIDMTCAEFEALMNQLLDPGKDDFLDLSLLDIMDNGICDRAKPNFPGAPFGGRDIIYIHGLQLSHLIDRSTGHPGATGKWPTNQNEYYNGYYKTEAYSNMLPHINHFLRSRGHKNRFLVVAYDCSENAEVAVHAVMTQIREAMQNGTGVQADPTDGRGKHCFGRDYVFISHSTGALIADVVLSIANKTKTAGYYQSKYGNVGLISDRCKGRMNIQGALSGSNLAKIALLGQSLPPSALNMAFTALSQTPVNLQNLHANPLLIAKSVLVDLTPEITRARWGALINDVPVPVFSIAGAHPTAILGPLKYIIHPGFDDGVLTMDCVNGNNNPLALGPSSFTANPLNLFDMGIPVNRAVNFYLDRRIAPGVFAATSTAYLSSTGMVEPVNAILVNPQNHFKNHYSFIQSTKEHWFNATESGSGNTPCDYAKTSPGIGVNNEEMLVVSDPSVFSPSLIDPAIISQMGETIKDKHIPYPVIRIIVRRGIPRATIVWKKLFIWKRTYHKLSDNCMYDVDYGYKYLFRQ